MHMKWNFIEIDSINVTILVRWQWYSNEFLLGNLPYSPKCWNVNTSGAFHQTVGFFEEMSIGYKIEEDWLYSWYS